MDSRQLALEIQIKEDFTFENYYKTKNEIVYDSLLKMLKGQENNFIYLYGEQGVGKTHLLHAACNFAYNEKHTATYTALSNASMLQELDKLDLVCLDDIHNIVGNMKLEESVFHLFNKMKERNNKLIFSANNPPNLLNLHLLDLASRLSSCVVYKLNALNDDEKLVVLKQRAQQKGLDLDDTVGLFLLHHFSRNISNLLNILDTLDKASLRNQRRLTVPFVKEVFKRRLI